MVYLFLDCDEYLVAQRLRELKAALGDAELADLNITELEGPQTRAGDILGQAAMMPFLAARRLIITRNFLVGLEKRMGQSKSNESAAHNEAAQLLLGLHDLPESCDLILLENGLDKRRAIWKGYSQKLDSGARAVPGLQALIQAKQIAQEELATPDARALPTWIQQRSQAKQIKVDGRAVQLLATFVGPNLRQLDNELEKLSLYAGKRPITADDIHRLVSDASEAMIWALTDALSQRSPRHAMQSLQALRRNDANAFYLLTMIARQYRVMLKVKEAMRAMNGPSNSPNHNRRGGNEFDIAKLVGESPYPVKKAMQQATNYSFDQLTDVLDRLLEADYAMKTGADPEAELDILIAELTQR